MSLGYKGNADNVVSSEYLYNTLKDLKSINDSSYADKSLEHSHTNKTSVLDKLDINVDGDLTFDGDLVNNGSTAITKHISDVDIHVDTVFKTDTNNHISDTSMHMSTSEKGLLTSAYQKPSTGIPMSDLSSDVQNEINKKANTNDIIDSTTSKIKEDLMNCDGVDHTKIKNIGTLSHDELEQILDNHVSNTIIHQTQSLGQLVVTGADFLAGTFKNCNYNTTTGYIELDKTVTTTPIEYTSDEAEYVSKVLNTGIVDCPYVTFSWLGSYNYAYTNIKAYIRYGTVSSVDATWTSWQEVPYDKSITGTYQYCQAKVVFSTADKFKNIVLKNIIIYYGVDMGSELVDSRVDLSGTIHPTLKMHLDNIETNVQTNTTNIATNAANIASNTSDIAANASNIATNTTDIAKNASDILNKVDNTQVANSTTLGLVKPEDKLSTDTDYTFPVKVDTDGKLFTTISKASIDTVTKHWIVNGVDTGVVAEGKSIKYIHIDDANNTIVTFTDGTTENIGHIDLKIDADFLTSDGFGNLRFYGSKFQYYDKSTSTWNDASITPSTVDRVLNFVPQPMEYIKARYNMSTSHFELTFKEPDDIFINGQMFCAVEKILLVRKEGSEPVDISDGTTVLELKRRDFGIYRKFPFVDTTFNPIIDTVTYYYKAFPVSTYGVANTLTENSVFLKAKDYYLYGFKLDQNESNPDNMITYLSDCDNYDYKSAYMDYANDKFVYGDWKTAWFIDKLKPCMLKYDGTVDYELDKNDYTKKTDGTASDVANASYGGNAMVGIPKVYWKIVDNGDNTANIYIASKQVDTDFHCWSHIDNNGNEIDYCYMPIYNGSVVSGKLRSLSGKAPINSQSCTSEITYAKANNLTSDIIWYTELFNDRMLINLLLLLIGKSADTQTVFGTGNNNSYVSTSNTGVKNTGTMNTKGLFWGNQDNVSGVKVFGMEHWWGNQWRRIAGWINDKGTQKIKMTYGQSDGSTTDEYNETGSGYISIGGDTPRGASGGYISKMLITDNGLIPTIASGSATTYYCDGLWFNNSQVDYARVGGYSGNISLVGALCSNLNAASSDSYWYIGAALSCKPLA